MQQGPFARYRCSRCRVPLNQPMAPCPHCGGAPEQVPPSPARPTHRKKSNLKPPVIIALVMLLVAVTAIAVVFLWRTDPDLLAPIASASASSPAPVAALTINGIPLADGPKVDPTDIIHLVQARVAGKQADESQLISITIQGVRDGKVDLDHSDASIRYEYLLIFRDPMTKTTRQRAVLTLQKNPPPMTQEEGTDSIKGVPDPVCVWSAAWQAAIASGFPKTESVDVFYGRDPKGRHPVWIFSLPSNPDMVRAVDGRNCAIKSSQRVFIAPTVLLPSEANDGAIYVEPSDAQ